MIGRRQLICGPVLLLCAAVSYGITWEKVFLVSQSGESGAKPGSRVVIKGKPVELVAIAQARDDGRVRYFGNTASFYRAGSPHTVEPPPDGFEIRWYKVEPLMYHEDGHGHDPANPTFLWYTNAGAPGGRTDRQPLSPDRLQYRETELPSHRGRWTIEPDARPSDSRYDLHDGLGTMRFRVSIKTPDGLELRSPGAASYRDLGIGNDVWRLTVIPESSYIGHLSGYFNVPGVFGSYPNQVDGYIGADCADLVVAGWNRLRRTAVPYTNVTGLRYDFIRQRRLRLILDDHYLTTAGTAKGWNRGDRELREPVSITISTAGVHVSDVIVFNYNPDPTDRSWDHVGVLYQDRGPGGQPNGKLDPEDLMLHAGPAEARIDPLGSSSFTGSDTPTRFAVLRWVP